MPQPENPQTNPPTPESKSFYPSPLLANIFAFACACFVENSSISFARSPAGFLGGLIVQLFLIVVLSNVFAYAASSRGKNKPKFGWTFFICTLILTALAYAISNQ